jgi:hypothetical protein
MSSPAFIHVSKSFSCFTLALSNSAVIRVYFLSFIICIIAERQALSSTRAGTVAIKSSQNIPGVLSIFPAESRKSCAAAFLFFVFTNATCIHHCANFAPASIPVSIFFLILSLPLNQTVPGRASCKKQSTFSQRLN